MSSAKAGRQVLLDCITAAQSNRNLDEVCRPCGVRPWFQIQTDSQAGILGKMGGLPDISGLGGGLGGGL